MSRDFNRGDVDYDYDMYKNRIRKFVVTGFIGKFRDRKPIWNRIEGYSPERGLSNLKRFDTSSFNEVPTQEEKK